MGKHLSMFQEETMQLPLLFLGLQVCYKMDNLPYALLKKLLLIINP